MAKGINNDQIKELIETPKAGVQMVFDGLKSGEVDPLAALQIIKNVLRDVNEGRSKDNQFGLEILDKEFVSSEKLFTATKEERLEVRKKMSSEVQAAKEELAGKYIDEAKEKYAVIKEGVSKGKIGKDVKDAARYVERDIKLASAVLDKKGADYSLLGDDEKAPNSIEKLVSGLSAKSELTRLARPTDPKEESQAGAVDNQTQLVENSPKQAVDTDRGNLGDMSSNTVGRRLPSGRRR